MSRNKSPGRRDLIILAGAVTLSALLYLPARNMGFFYDDKATVTANTAIQSGRAVPVLMENPFRAIVNVTFALQHGLNTQELPPYARTMNRIIPYIESEYFPRQNRIHAVYKDPYSGKRIPVILDLEKQLAFPLPEALPFRAVNFMLHALNAAFLLLLARRLGAKKNYAALAAAVFMVHPLATEPVNYITARFTLMSATFSLAALYVHLGEAESARRHAFSITLFTAALFCKETAAALPAVVLFLDLLQGRRKRIVIVWFALAAAYFVLRMGWLVVPGNQKIEVLPWHSYIIAEQRVLWLCLAKILLPVNLNFDYDLSPRPALDLLFASLNAGLLTIGVYAAANLYRGGKKGLLPGRSALATVSLLFLMGWTALSPTFVIPLADLAKEDRAYPLLAMVAVSCLAFALPLVASPEAGKKTRKPVLVCATLIFLFMSILTFNRNTDYSTEHALFRDTAMKSPLKPRAVYNYANALKLSRQLEKALSWFELAYSMDPGNEDAAQNIVTLRRLIREGEKKGGAQKIEPGKEPWRIMP